jgi:hypothetical protein
MKNTILAFAITILLLSGVASAQIREPMPIAVKVVAAYQSGLTVSVVNLRTGESMIGKTNPVGEFMAEWANSELGYAVGDQFKIIVEGGTEKTVKYDGAPVGLVTINLVNQECPTCSECPTCPAIPECICQVCQDCPSCPDQEPCPVDPVVFLEGLGLAGIIAATGFFAKKKFTKKEIKSLEDSLAAELKVGSGFRAYKANDGVVRFRHLHTGIVGYHDPTIIHGNPKYKHEPGVLMV